MAGSTVPLFALEKYKDDSLDTSDYHRDMIKFYGISSGETCGRCNHLLKVRPHDYAYFKCSRSHMSASAATDWRKHWVACGNFELAISQREGQHG